jgi:metallo-beta-lactamase class B
LALNDPELQRVEPFQIFDNLYYVGTDWVSCYALTTSEGIVLIDALYGDLPILAVENLELLGLNPTDIRYVLVTHGHFDHAGGAAFFQETFGARVGMTQTDWDLAAIEAKGRFFTPGAPRPDLVLADGDSLRVGDQTIHFYVTPGHTEGVLSMRFPVYDGGEAHEAFVFGGVGLNFEGVPRTLSYIESVNRIRELATGRPVIEVNVGNHPTVGRIFERHEPLVQRQRGDPHPYVDPDAFLEDLDLFLRNAEAKLVEERAAAGL